MFQDRCSGRHSLGNRHPCRFQRFPCKSWQRWEPKSEPYAPDEATLNDPQANLPCLLRASIKRPLVRAGGCCSQSAAGPSTAAAELFGNERVRG